MAGPTVQRAQFIQFGAQSVFDTAVPATYRYVGDLQFNENVDYYIQPYPQRVRGPVSGQQVNIHNGWVGRFTSEATYEEVITMLEMTLKGGVSGAGIGADKTWTFTLPHASDPVPTLYTGEYALNNFTTSYGRQVPNVLGKQIALSFPKNAVGTMVVDMFGGAVAVNAPTAALTNVTGREVAKANLMKVYIDDAGSSIGGTLKSGSVTKADVMLDGGLMPDDTLDGRVNLDYGKYVFDDITGNISLVMEYVGDANAEVVKWRANAKRFIRLVVTGTTVSALAKTLQIDLCVEYAKAVVLGKQNGNDVVTVQGDLRYDGTWAKMGVFTVINALSTAP